LITRIEIFSSRQVLLFLLLLFFTFHLSPFTYKSFANPLDYYGYGSRAAGMGNAQTALANDFSFDEVFSRQLESMGRSGDVLLALSTSGGSRNLVRAVESAKRLGLHAFAFSGKGGGRLAEVADLAVIVPHDDFARIQEVHMALGHILCGLVEEMIQPSR